MEDGEEVGVGLKAGLRVKLRTADVLQRGTSSPWRSPSVHPELQQRRQRYSWAWRWGLRNLLCEVLTSLLLSR